eukprot:364708-Chlamydomonas_euryale.AAC.13
MLHAWVGATDDGIHHKANDWMVATPFNEDGLLSDWDAVEELWGHVMKPAGRSLDHAESSMWHVLPHCGFGHGLRLRWCSKYGHGLRLRWCSKFGHGLRLRWCSKFGHGLRLRWCSKCAMHLHLH